MYRDNFGLPVNRPRQAKDLERARLLDELNVDPLYLVGSDRDPALCVATQ